MEDIKESTEGTGLGTGLDTNLEQPEFEEEIKGPTVEQDSAETNDLSPEDLAYIMPFDEFIAENKPHKGLVASFKVETKDLSPRSQTAWEEAFQAQSKRVYK